MKDQQTKASTHGGGLLSLNDLAEYLFCSRTYAHKLISDGSIPSFRIGGTLRRVRREDVDTYVERQCDASED